MQDVAGAGSARVGGADCDQGVVAPDLGVREPRAALLLGPVGLADGGVDVEGEGRLARPGTGPPGSGQQLAADGVQLTGVPPGEGAQEGADGRRCRHPLAEYRLGGTRPEEVDIVDAVRPGQESRDQGHRLEVGVGGTGDAVSKVEALADELPRLEPRGQLRGQAQTGVGHQVAVIEGDVEVARRVRDLHLTGDPRLRRWL